MKLYTSDNTELMEVAALEMRGRDLIVAGTIMGAMPTRAILRPAELRNALKLLNVRIVWFIVRMLFAK